MVWINADCLDNLFAETIVVIEPADTFAVVTVVTVADNFIVVTAVVAVIVVIAIISYKTAPFRN